MRFECPNCSTVYDVPDDKVGRTAKLKCSVCGNIWKITLPSQPDDVLAGQEAFSKAVDSFEEDSPFENDAPFEENGSVEEKLPSQEENPSEAEAEVGETEPEDDTPAKEEAPADYSQFVPPPPEPEDPVNIDDLNAFFDYAPDAKAVRAAENKRKAALLAAAGVFLFFAAIVLMIFAPEKDLPVSFENVRYFFSEEDYKHFLNVEGAVVNKATVTAEVGEFSVRFFNKSGINIANQTMPSVLPALPPAKPVPFALKIERPPATAQKIELILKEVRPAPVVDAAQKTPEPEPKK